MSRSCGVAVPAVLLLVLLAATATAAINPQAEAPQDDKPLDHLAHRLPLLKEEPAARIASTEPAARLESVRPADHVEHGLPLMEEPAARLESVPPVEHVAQGVPLKEEPAARIASAEPAAGIALAEKKDGGGDAATPMEAASGVAIQGGDPGTVPSAGSDNGGSASGEHGKEQSGKEAEKSASAAKSCLTKEECHKKRLLCGKGCTMSAHAKCAAKCSKACIPTC
jgi:hypothetical protein